MPLFLGDFRGITHGIYGIFVVGIYGYMATSIQLWHCFREQLLSLNDSNFRTPKINQVFQIMTNMMSWIDQGKIHGPVWLGETTDLLVGSFLRKKTSTNLWPPQRNDPKTDEFINTEIKHICSPKN